MPLPRFVGFQRWPFQFPPRCCHRLHQQKKEEATRHCRCQQQLILSPLRPSLLRSASFWALHPFALLELRPPREQRLVLGRQSSPPFAHSSSLPLLGVVAELPLVLSKGRLRGLLGRSVSEASRRGLPPPQPFPPPRPNSKGRMLLRHSSRRSPQGRRSLRFPSAVPLLSALRRD